MITAKVFKSGNSQAVRLPKEYRLDADEVFVNRIGNVLILVSKDDPWAVFSAGIREVGDDFPKSIDKVKLSKRVALK
jgi:antitoxin VapB